MRAEHQAGWFRHFQKYTRCPKPTNQPHINMIHSCQQHPILPSFQGPLALPITDGTTENTRVCPWPVLCPAFKASRGGVGRSRCNCSGACSRAPCCPDLNVSSGPCPVSHSGHRGRTGSELPPQRLFCSGVYLTRSDLFGGTWSVRAGWPGIGA